MTEEQLTSLFVSVLQPTILLSVVGGIISLITSYVYGFREWYAKLQPEQKGLGQVLLCTIVVMLMGILSWTHVLMIVPDNKMGFFTLLIAWVGALVSNQTTYQLSKPVASVLLIKESARKEGLVEAKEDVNQNGS